MCDRHSTTVADAARAARDDDPGPWSDTPSAEDVAELGPPKPFTRPVARVYDPIPDWSDLAAKWGREVADASRRKERS
jgi:hypothetical protein